jgi:hypothetical protein
MKLLRPPRKPKHNPLFVDKLSNPKYETWKAFVIRGKSAADVA